MGNFPGGSAYAMVREIAEGYFSVTERTFTRMTRPELDKLRFELDRLLREIRGNQPALEDLAEVQKRNRRILRINTANMVLRSYRMKRKI
ncbi:MAG: hypothetical protein AAF481_00170 [Acidobacteriota bacterium]